MILVFSIAVFVTALLAAFVFHSALLPCLLAALCAAGLGAAEFLVFRKKPKLRMLGVLGCLLLSGVSVWIPAAVQSYGTGDYAKLYGEYAENILRDKYDKATPLRTELEEKYGTDDGIRYLEGMAAIARNDVNTAEENANGFLDKTDLTYYTLMEEVCRLRYPDAEDRSKALRSLYQDAVSYHPDWAYGLKQLGILLFYDKEYDRARGYLTGAADRTEEPDGEILCYLGASFVEQGDNERGAVLLSEAYACTLSDSCRELVLWYAQKAGMGGEA